jgi:hypothetical protein
MPEPPEYERQAVLLRRIGTLLYGGPTPREPFTVEAVYSALGEDELVVDSALKKLERAEVISLDLRGARIGLLGNGRSLYASNAIAEAVLGRDYIAKRLAPAVVHIIVKNSLGDESGATGFFPSFPWNSIITAAHVLSGRTLEKVICNDGNEISPERPAQPLYGPDGLDLAIIHCQMPAGVDPIPLDWKPGGTFPLAELIVLGYPRIAGVHPGLHHATAQLHQIGRKYSERDSLIISSSQPGCSGGPVLDTRGHAIGVVEQESISEEQGRVTSFFSATPAHYLSELMQ